MRKTNLTLLVVAFLMICSLWLLINPIQASGEGENTIEYSIVDYRHIFVTQDLSKTMSLQEMKEQFEESNKIKIEIDHERVKANQEKAKELRQKELKESEFQYYIDNGKKDYYELTSYTNGYESTQKKKGQKGYGITASGEKTKENHTIACPKRFDFGTKIYIPSLDNVYTCLDWGGAIKGKKLDVFIKDLDEAIEFGRKKNVEVYIVEE